MSRTLANRKVLVLNRGWSPIAVIGLKRAMCLIVGTKARILLPIKNGDSSPFWQDFTWADWGKLMPKNEEEAIHGSNRKFCIPEIILLSQYNSLPQQRIHFSRRTIYHRDGNQCQYCGKKPGTAFLNLDHIVPKSKGGLTEWTNICLSCVDCNREKADRMPSRTVILEKVKDANGDEVEKAVPYFIVYFNGNRFPCGKKLLRQPNKPKFTLYKGDYKCDSWVALMGESYWSVELQNDM